MLPFRTPRVTNLAADALLAESMHLVSLLAERDTSIAELKHTIKKLKLENNESNEGPVQGPNRASRVVLLSGFSGHPTYNAILAKIKTGKLVSIDILSRKQVIIVFVDYSGALALVAQSPLGFMGPFGRKDQIQVAMVEDTPVEIPNCITRILQLEPPAGPSDENDPTTAGVPSVVTSVDVECWPLDREIVTDHGIFSNTEANLLMDMGIQDKCNGVVRLVRIPSKIKDKMRIQLEFRSIEDCCNFKRGIELENNKLWRETNVTFLSDPCDPSPRADETDLPAMNQMAENEHTELSNEVRFDTDISKVERVERNRLSELYVTNTTELTITGSLVTTSLDPPTAAIEMPSSSSDDESSEEESTEEQSPVVPASRRRQSALLPRKPFQIYDPTNPHGKMRVSPVRHNVFEQPHEVERIGNLNNDDGRRNVFEGCIHEEQETSTLNIVGSQRDRTSWSSGFGRITEAGDTDNDTSREEEETVDASNITGADVYPFDFSDDHNMGGTVEHDGSIFNQLPGDDSEDADAEETPPVILPTIARDSPF